MKRFIPIMLCLALLFGGIAGCATTKVTDPVDVTEVDEKPYIVDFDFPFDKKEITLNSCKDNQYKAKMHHVHAILSNEEEKCTNMVTMYDPDCNDYPLFQLTSSGPVFVKAFDSLDDLRVWLMQEVEKTRRKE